MKGLHTNLVCAFGDKARDCGRSIISVSTLHTICHCYSSVRGEDDFPPIASDFYIPVFTGYSVPRDSDTIKGYLSDPEVDWWSCGVCEEYGLCIIKRGTYKV